MSRIHLCLVALALAWPRPVAAQSALPLAEDVDWGRLRKHCQRLLQTLETLKAPLPEETARALRAAIEDDAMTTDVVIEKVQKLLDTHCLVGVTINPESRVKAARGPASAELLQGHETLLLIKIDNQAGVTHALAVLGPQIRTPGKTDRGWLEIIVETDRRGERKLSGQRLEYVILRLKAHEAGKREATLKLDVGQGTQDLGFRAEVPILFAIRPAKQ